MLGLRRWFGSTRDRAAIRKRASEALDACPKQAHRQRSFLHVLLGDFEPAAMLLAGAPGLGWSDGDHPGHLLFPVFEAILGGKRVGARRRGSLPAHPGMDVDHAAELVAACVACDPSAETARWFAATRAEYRRYPALHSELDRALIWAEAPN